MIIGIWHLLYGVLLYDMYQKTNTRLVYDINLKCVLSKMIVTLILVTTNLNYTIARMFFPASLFVSVHLYMYYYCLCDENFQLLTIL